jgi:hypothetical protein
MNETSVTIAMTVNQWNIVMKDLGELPFKETADIIMSIKTQAEMQLAPKADVADAPAAE